MALIDVCSYFVVVTRQKNYSTTYRVITIDKSETVDERIVKDGGVCQLVNRASVVSIGFQQFFNCILYIHRIQGIASGRFRLESCKQR